MCFHVWYMRTDNKASRIFTFIGSSITMLTMPSPLAAKWKPSDTRILRRHQNRCSENKFNKFAYSVSFQTQQCWNSWDIRCQLTQNRYTFSLLKLWVFLGKKITTLLLPFFLLNWKRSFAQVKKKKDFLL